MMPHERRAVLDATLAATREMRMAAESGDWQVLARFEANRRDLVDRLFSEQPPESEYDVLVDALTEIREQDAVVLAALETARSALGHALHALERGRHGADLYLQTAEGHGDAR